MKINIDVDSKYPDIGVDIHVPSLTPEVEKIISLMRMMDMQIAVKKGDETVLLDVGDILYIEAVERNTFIYTEKETYEALTKALSSEKTPGDPEQNEAENIIEFDEKRLKNALSPNCPHLSPNLRAK